MLYLALKNLTLRTCQPWNQRLTGHFEIWDFNHPALTGPIMTRAYDALGFLFDRACCSCDFTGLCCVATNSLFIFSIFQVHSDGSRRFPWTRTCCKGGLQKKGEGMCSIDSFKMDWMTFSFFFIHCSKIFNFVFLDLSSSWWRGRWYPWIRHGSLSDRCYELTWLCWVIWTSKERKGFFRDPSPLSLPPKRNENLHFWLQARGASHDM